jgi:DNA-directed RNA polymerase specialized sigma24 family protein
MNQNSTPENELNIQTIKTSDDLKQLYDLYAGSLLAMISLVVKDEEKQLSILSSSFIRIWESIAKYERSRYTFFIWIIQIMLNEEAQELKQNPEKLKKNFWRAFIKLKEDIDLGKINTNQ